MSKFNNQNLKLEYLLKDVEVPISEPLKVNDNYAIWIDEDIHGKCICISNDEIDFLSVYIKEDKMSIAEAVGLDVQYGKCDEQEDGRGRVITSNQTLDMIDGEYADEYFFSEDELKKYLVSLGVIVTPKEDLLKTPMGQVFQSMAKAYKKAI